MACFPIKLVWLPLLLLPGPGLGYAFVFVLVCVCGPDCAWAARVFVCLHSGFYGKISKGLRAQPPSITSSGGKWREAWRTERDGGRRRKPHLEESEEG